MAAMTERQKYLFDTMGYCVLRGALSAEEVAAANAAIDKHAAEILERDDPRVMLAVGSSTLKGNGRGRYDLGGMLGWPAPDNAVFRSLLCHPSIMPTLHEIVGEGYRLDHAPLCIIQRKGSEGFNFHGGALTPDGKRNYNLAYDFAAGGMRCNLVNVSLALTPTAHGDGGFCVIPGSHKSNYPCPDEITKFEACQEVTQQVPVEPGDVIIFAEAAQHGTLPWVAEHERRVALLRFAPHYFAYGRAYLSWPDDHFEGITDAQRAVLEPPYNNRLDRPLPDPLTGGVTNTEVRSKAKKDFDQKVFGTTYF
eukprot:jgi/Tetstr1/420338/TSEL_011459.t1